MAQACHACVAAVWLQRDAAHTAAYCSPEALDSMHKARPGSCACGGAHSGRQVVLEVKGEAELRALAASLAAAGVAHKLWVEQPEGVATCLAAAPAPKETLQPHFRRLQLCK